MTPQELYEETKLNLNSDMQNYQQIQNEIQIKQKNLNELTNKIVGNQKLLEGIKKIDGVSIKENN
tara:strand:- start:421 stop:615 length:195 start_codon:yes stop_codon:yes gene_type:complete